VVARKYRLQLLKIIALLSQVRWYNIILLASAQYLAGVFVMNSPNDWLQTISDKQLHLIVFASLFVIAGGFIINNFYDQEKDLVNRPKQTLFEKIISRNTQLNFYLVFTLIGLLLAFAVSLKAVVFFATFTFGLWFYSHKLKKIAWIGNIAGAFLAVIPFFGIFYYYDQPTLNFVLYVGMMVVAVFAKDVAKDTVAQKGDLIYGYATLPAIYGFAKAKIIIIGSLLIVPLLTAIMLPRVEQAMYALLVVANSLVLITIIQILTSKEPKDIRWTLVLLKFIIVGGVFSLAFFQQ
jgi:4-hydroxybenzoate polyprenyltransferase